MVVLLRKFINKAIYIYICFFIVPFLDVKIDNVRIWVEVGFFIDETHFKKYWTYIFKKPDI